MAHNAEYTDHVSVASLWSYITWWQRSQ